MEVLSPVVGFSYQFTRKPFNDSSNKNRESKLKQAIKMSLQCHLFLDLFK